MQWLLVLVSRRAIAAMQAINGVASDGKRVRDVAGMMGMH